ncbi:MAG: hypothetical protein GY799_18050, partial [Desulfobulbaceae bacterium]|nr:hypothetical protein [Desulfobulbaceae bacterium]
MGAEESSSTGEVPKLISSHRRQMRRKREAELEIKLGYSSVSKLSSEEEEAKSLVIREVKDIPKLYWNHPELFKDEVLPYMTRECDREWERLAYDYHVTYGWSDGEGAVSTTTQGQMIYHHMFRLAQALKYPVNHAAHTVDGVEYTTIRQAVDQMRQWKWDAEDKQKKIYQLQDQHVKCMQSYERVISNYQRSIQEVETVKLVPDWLFCGDARANKVMMPMYPLVAFAQEVSKSSISLD